MFDFGWSELVLIGIVALIVIGPKELPTVLRTLGTYMGKVKRMASEFQGQFNEAIREAELEELRREAEKLTNIKNPLGDNFDPEELRREAEKLTNIKNPLGDNFDPVAQAKTEIQSAVEGTPKPETAPAAPPAEVTPEPEKQSESQAPAEPQTSGGRAS